MPGHLEESSTQQLRRQNSKLAHLPTANLVQLGGMVFAAGITGVDPQTGRLAQNCEEQFALAFQNLDALLGAAGVQPRGVSLVTVAVPDVSYRPFINAGWSR